MFFGRFVVILRVTAAWTTGLSRMNWWRFLVWNTVGAIVWATGVALVAYYLGEAATSAIGRYGLYAAGGVILLAVIGYLVVKRLKKGVAKEE